MFTNTGKYGMQGQSSIKFKMASGVLNKKKGLVKHVNSERSPQKNTGAILVEDSPLTNRSTEELEVFSEFFSPLSP